MTMGKTLKVSTIVQAPAGSAVGHVVLEAGSEPPEWALELLGEHLFEEPAVSVPAEPPTGLDEAGVVAEPTPPPKAGPGSGTEAWAQHAEAVGVEVPEGAKRDEIVQALADAGKPVE